MEKLFENFSPITNDEWKEKVIKDLKGADFNKKLLWNPSTDLSFLPYYSTEDKNKTSYLEKYQNSSINSDGINNARHWDFMQYIIVEDEKKANELTLDSLNNGANGLTFDCSKLTSINWEILFDNILFEYCKVSFVWGNNTSLALNLLEYLNTNSISIELLNGVFIWNKTINKEKLFDCFVSYKEVENIQFFGFKNEVEKEITDDLSSQLLFYNTLIWMSNSTINKEEIISNFVFITEYRNSYFLEIAKQKSLILLATEIVNQYGFEEFTPDLIQLYGMTKVKTTEEIDDTNLNMLSNTTQAMSAIISGVQYLSILPHNSEEFAHRIARNVSNLLREESYFDQIVDPTAGSYYIEQLTDQIAEKAWKKFQENC